MGISSVLKRQARKIKKLSKPATDGQEKIEPVTREQRAYAKGQVKAAGATAALAGLGVTELLRRLDKADTEKERAQLKAAIEMAVAEANKEESAKPKRTVPRNSQSPKPKLRPKEMNKGGMANCGASMKATQKSTQGVK